jgi:hypothetical protein
MLVVIISVGDSSSRRRVTLNGRPRGMISAQRDGGSNGTQQCASTPNRRPWSLLGSAAIGQHVGRAPSCLSFCSASSSIRYWQYAYAPARHLSNVVASTTPDGVGSWEEKRLFDWDTLNRERVVKWGLSYRPVRSTVLLGKRCGTPYDWPLGPQ